jgi:hypothetical protein
MVPPAAGELARRRLPIADEIVLDHVAHFVRDPAAAGRALARAGFAPTPVSIQLSPGQATDAANGAPRLTGTGNVTAMLAQGYVELLFKTADTPLGRELDTAMTRYPGLHLVAFAVADAAKAHGALAERGFRMQPLVAMQRPVDTATGTATAAFTVARVAPGEMPEGRIQMLTHHTEHALWQPRWLSHPNGARGLASVMIAVADVGEAARRFARFSGRAAMPGRRGETIMLDRGRVDLVSAAAFARLLPELPIPSLPFVGACGIEVESLATLQAALARGGLTARQTDHGLAVIFPHELGRGAWLFTEELGPCDGCRTASGTQENSGTAAE